MATSKKPASRSPTHHNNGASAASHSRGEEAPRNSRTEEATRPSVAAPLNFDIEMVRGVISSTLGASQGMLGFFNEMQQLNTRALKEMTTRLNEAVVQARDARDLQELIGVQLALVNSQMAIASQTFGATAARFMNAEADLVEQTQDGAARLSRQMLGSGDNSDARESTTRSVVEDTPLAWLGNAQSAWTEMTGRWVEMAKVAAAGKTLPQF